MFTIYHNILPNHNMFDLYDNLRKRREWSFDLVSDFSNPKNNYRFWNLRLNDDSFFTDTIFNRIQELTDKKFELLNVSANGQTYGLPGNLHIDMKEENTYTFLYYVNPVWEVTWGGETVFAEIPNKIQNKLLKTFDKGFTHVSNTQTIFPVPNMGILFKSNILHAGLEPTRHFKDLRITVAFKLIEI